MRRYLAQSLGFEIERVDAFRGLVGPEVLATPAFKDNILSFGVCYGLCLQGLQSGGLRTNLLPREISMDRLIRRKKPWAVAAAALVMLACTVSYAAYALQYNAVKPDDLEGRHRKSRRRARANQNAGKTDTILPSNNTSKRPAKGDRLVSNVQDRDRWLKFLTAVNECLPPYEVEQRRQDLVEPPPTATDIPVVEEGDHAAEPTAGDEHRLAAGGRRGEVVCRDEGQGMVPPDTGTTRARNWANRPARCRQELKRQAQPPGVAGASAPSSGPTGPGHIVQIYGRHFHNDRSGVAGTAYVHNTLVTKLASRKMVDLGVSFPVLVKPPSLDIEEIQLPAPKHEGTQGEPGGMMTGPRSPLAHGRADPAADNKEKKVIVPRFRFRVQFVWQPDKAVSGQVAAAGAAGRPVHRPRQSKSPQPRPEQSRRRRCDGAAAPAAPPAPAPGPVPKKP